jgi:hypothetical protein
LTVATRFEHWLAVQETHEGSNMKTSSRIGLVLGGYAVALGVAFALVYIRDLLTAGTDAQASQGMYAWGDSILFIAAFSVTALIPTGLALYFLRPYPMVWTGLSILGLAVAITGPLGACLSAWAHTFADHGSALGMAGGLGFLRTMGAPLLAIAFLTCAIFAPSKRPRLAMLMATGLECAASAYFFVHLWLASVPSGP